MKLSKVIALMWLSIGVSASQISFGTEVGNYWIVNNTLNGDDDESRRPTVRYELEDEASPGHPGRHTFGDLPPGLNGKKPPYIYSSFPDNGCSAPTLNRLLISTASGEPLCEFKMWAATRSGPRARICSQDIAVGVEPKREGVTCSPFAVEIENGGLGDTVYTRVSVSCDHCL